MTQEHASTCPLGLTAKDLSDWRAQGKRAATARHIEAHVAGCAACRAQLAAYDEIDARLRTQRFSASGGDHWQMLRPRLSESHPRRQQRARVARRAAWGTLVAAVALLIVVGAFAQLLSHRSMSTSTQPVTLSWLRGTVPMGIANLYVRTDWRALPVAQSDGNTLYGCEVPSPSRDASAGAPQGSDRPEIWVTHDRALHWKQVGALPITQPDVSLCYLTVDMLNPAIVVAVAAWPAVGNRPTPGHSASFVTFTGGQSWQALRDEQSAQITRLATSHGVTYAFFDSIYPIDRHLMASTDHMQTWHPIDQAIAASGQYVLDFVAASGDNIIWAQVGKDGVPTRQFWTTRDGGQTWNPQPAPLAEQYAIGPKTSSTAETICATNYSASHGAGASNQLFCSSDGGGHWSTRDGLNVPATIAVGPAHAGEIPPIQLLAVASDGAVLALDDGSPTPRIYRLPAGASQWQLIAALPIPARMVVIYCPQPGAGVLWASNMGGQAAQPNKMLFTASYS